MGNFCGGTKLEPELEVYIKNYYPKSKEFQVDTYEIAQDFQEEDKVVKAAKFLPIDDDVAQKVERIDNLAKQKEKNRVVEYLILVSAEMTNQIVTKPHRSCVASELQPPSTTVITSQEDNIFVPDLGPGLPRPKYKGGSPGGKSTASSMKGQKMKLPSMPRYK